MGSLPGAQAGLGDGGCDGALETVRETPTGEEQLPLLDSDEGDSSGGGPAAVGVSPAHRPPTSPGTAAGAAAAASAEVIQQPFQFLALPCYDAEGRIHCYNMTTSCHRVA